MSDQPPATVVHEGETLPALRPDRRIVDSPIAVMDTASFEHMGRIAAVMANAGLMPESLTYDGPKDKRVALHPDIVKARAFLITAQAIRWNMDPLAVMGCCSLVHNKLMYEGKLVAAVIEARLGVRLDFQFGKWDQKRLAVQIGMEATDETLGVVVSGLRHGDSEPQTVEGYVGLWRTTGNNSPWQLPANWRRQLRYRGTREWANAYSPGVILGVLTDDDIDELDRRPTVISEGPRPQLEDALTGGKAPDPTSSKSRGRKGTPNVQSAEEPSDTKASATDASGASAEGSSGQPAPSEPTSAGAEGEQSQGENNTTATESATSAADTETSKSPATSGDSPADTDDEEAITLENLAIEFTQGVASDTSWLSIRPRVLAIRKEPSFQHASRQRRKEILLVAFERAIEINDPVKATEDPGFFRLWLLQAAKEDIRPAFRSLSRSQGYSKLNDEQKALVGEETAQAEADGGSQ